MIGSTRAIRVFARTQPTDLRAGYDGLYGLVLRELGRDPMKGDLFLFVNRRRRSRRAEAESRMAEAERQRASQLATEVQTLQRSHAELGVETEALKVEVEVLLKRITQLTCKLAAATDRDAQLELELELRHLRGQLAAANQERFGTRSERRDRPDDGDSEDSSETKPQTKDKKKKEAWSWPDTAEEAAHRRGRPPPR